MADSETSKHTIPSLAKAIKVVQLIAKEGPIPSSASLARKAKVTQSTCYRILRTLEEASWVQQEAGGYQISMGLLSLVQPLSQSAKIAEYAMPALEDVARRCGVTAKLSARRGRMQITLAVGFPRTPMGILTPTGVPFPVIEAASGAALLARLPRAELMSLIESTPSDHWRIDTQDRLLERIEHYKRRKYIENIGHHPQGIDAIACPMDFEREPLALSLIYLRGAASGPEKRHLVKELFTTRDLIAQMLE